MRAASTVDSEIGAIPGFLPGVVMAAIAGGVLSSVVGRTLRIHPVLAWALTFTFGLVIAATVTPSREAIDLGISGAGTCDLSRTTFLPLADLGRVTDSALNVWLFIPLGGAIGLLPRSRRTAGVAALAFALPFGIELLQLLAPILDRACQSADVVDNLSGLVVGATAGSVLGAVLRLRGPAGPAEPAPPPSQPSDWRDSWPS